MSVTLPTSSLQFLDSLVAGGSYATREDAAIAAVELMRKRHEQLKELQAAVQEGIDDRDAGRSRKVEIGEILAAGRRRLAEQAETQK